MTGVLVSEPHMTWRMWTISVHLSVYDSVSKCQSTNSWELLLWTFYHFNGVNKGRDHSWMCPFNRFNSCSDYLPVARCTSTTCLEILCRTYECHCQWDYNGVAGANSCVCRILMCRNLHATTKEIPSHTRKPSREGWVIWVKFVWLSTLGRMSML